MSRARETVLIAEDLYQGLGPAAVGLAEARSDALREVGDMDGAQFWRDVSRALILIVTRPNAVLRQGAPGATPDNFTWSLMQRIEGYRHLASEAEGIERGIGQPGPEMARIARGWRELAGTLEQLAATLHNMAPQETFQGGVYELN